MKNKKRKKRIASFITAAVMLSGMLPLDYISDINFSGISLPHFKFSQLTADAEDEFEAVNGWVTITTAESFKTYCASYNNDDTFASKHQNDNINLTLQNDDSSTRGTFPADMVGLGTHNYPFKGSIMIPDNGREGEITFSMNGPMFNYVCNSVKILSNSGTNEETMVVFNRLNNVEAGTSKPLLAQYVMSNIENKAPANWKVRLSENNQYTYSGVIGEICENAEVNLTFKNNSDKNVINDADAGIICGKIDNGSSLNLTYTESDAVRTITSVNGNAGGLVGTMKGSAALTINEMPTTSRNITASNGYAGGLVGEMTSDSRITVAAQDATIPINSGTVSSALGAGGFCGHYTNKVTTSFDLSQYIINTTAVYGQYCGGIFGVLENKKADSESAIEYTITGTSAGTLTVNSGSDTTYANTGYFGGVIGKYTTDNLANSLILNNLTVNAASQTSFNAFGGAIGLVDSAAYITADDVNITAGGTNMRTAINSNECPNYAFFGGLVGATANSNGVLIDLGNFTLNTNNEYFCGGGVVGQFYNGVLRLRGTTDMTGAKPEGSYTTDNNTAMRYASYGQLVGTNDNVLVYALGNGNDKGWTFKRSSGAVSDDLGTWGEVVRISNIETEVLTYSDTEHTVTVKSAVSSIVKPADFVRTALNIQLNQGSDYDCLKFAEGTENTRATLLGNNSTLTLTADINLTGTGVNGFMRDGCVVNASNDNKPVSQITSSAIGDTGAFTGILNGGSHTVTLAIGESYGDYTDGQTEGTGQIYRHQYNGLFSVIGNGNEDAEINNLKINGTINVRNAGQDGMFIGGIAARSHGSVTLNSITANEAINYHEGAKSPGSDKLGKNIGGFIGYVSGSGTIAVIGTSEALPYINLSGHHEGWNVYGGAIGKVVSDSFTINIAQDESDSLKVKMTSDVSKVTNVGSNSDCGGLIGYIISTGSYKNRNVNIKHLIFQDCVVANASSQNGGGFLGFSWLNTTVKIDGVEVNGNSNIENTIISNSKSNHVGVMCYNATGKWTVDSLAINSLTVNNGAVQSLGMIVNKAYEGNDGLYLDILNSGYTLTEADITLPATIGIFDEIAAYSASDVINGRNTTNNDKGTGVISIDMNSDRSGTDAKITHTGTYQNRISSKNLANPNSRYYYNLNHINSADGGQKLLKWSVYKYAADKISSEFSTTGDPLGTTESETSADLTGLSFYPVPDAGGSTIGNLNVTFDYETINTIEASNGSDNYARDPAAQNQHYLMQSGLFLNLSEGKTLTINGKLTLNGNFLSADEYKGVLISDTMKGSLDSSGGSILLNGIKPSTAESYLLINNITRDSTTSSPLSMKLSNVSTGKGYTTGDTTPQIAKSLIGAVSGPGLNIEFSRIKLDSRTSNDSISGASTKQITALDTAYKTKNSIFTDATLLESIKSDDTSVLVYNYTFDEDWGTGSRNVTYGKEITSSVEYEGLEKQYYGDKRYYTNPLTAPDENSGEFDFSTVFLKYVSAAYDSNKDANGLYSRELKVNVMTLALNVGCGTYNDPYIITNGKQLEAVSKFINGGNTSDLSKVNLPKTSGDFDNLAENTTGSRWCSDKSGSEYHAEYVPNSGATGYESTAENAKTWTKENVQYYLANAYYKINNDIEVSDFLGLGGGSDTTTAANTAFRGVIVGEKNDDGTPKYTITNKSDKPFINVSNGCVVKDINIVVDKDIALSQVTSGSANAAFGYVSKCSYYGGVIGEVMGGDNIIDNCYVTFNDDRKVTLSGTYGMLCPVGSYVGVVVFGAVIFKNIDSVKANKNASALNVYYGEDTTNLTAEDSKGAIYVNPLVGRVINGYAVNETTQFSVTENNKYHDDEGTYRAGTQHSLKNTTKHYTIADININEEDKLDVRSVPTSTTADGEINITNSQAFFILSLITQSCAGTANTADGGYSNSLSYGTNTTVYGMSHGANYDNIGTNETSVSDYSDYVNMYDTAANTAVPYIISRYTKKNTVFEVATNKLDNTVNLDGKTLYISNKRGANEKYLIAKVKDSTHLQNTNSIDSATEFLFSKVNGGERDGQYTISFNDGTTTKYLYLDSTKLSITDSPDYYNIEYTQGVWLISDADIPNTYINNNDSQGFTWWKDGISDSGNKLFLSETTSTEKDSYQARCVTSTLGYYDINLTENEAYVLPDSFRGLGTVGFYDDKNKGNNNDAGSGYPKRCQNRYCMKVDTFKGNYLTIDEDIYLNKYTNDNYFDKLHKNSTATQDITSGEASSANNNSLYHGIGLFDSIVMKDTNSNISDFTLSGSVNTNVFADDGTGKTSAIGNQYLGIASGGVVGWSLNGTWCNFSNINLNNLSVRGACQAAGLLGYSGNKSKKIYINVTECSAENLSLNVYATAQESKNSGTNVRSAMGAFIGKVKEGGVKVYGTNLKSANNDSSKFSTVKFSRFNAYNDASVSAGGLVGYAGNGCQAYDMHVESQTSSKPITIGNTSVGKAGGIVGLMQPVSASNPDCIAEFINCEVKNINIQAMHAGGLYGGTWSNDWSAYSIKIENCKVTGDPRNHNTIIAIQSKDVDINNDVSYAGGLVGHGYVVSAAGEGANIEISNSMVSNYDISCANVTSYSGAGGFIGYANAYGTNSIVCYIHDSAVENCVIGSTDNYAGGTIGNLAKNTENKLLGYNIKLNNVESQSTYMGAWVGYMDKADTATSIQFTGMAIYGNGFEKNIGNWTTDQNKSNTKTSFVFADYLGNCNENVSAESEQKSGLNYSPENHVDMPLYPYVNVYPHSSFGTGEIITGDGAVLCEEENSNGTGKNTIAAKVLADISDINNSRRYTTFSDAVISGENTIKYYLNRSSDEDCNRISTYKTETGNLPDGVDDFAVIVISNSDTNETTNLLSRYIQLVTNTATDYSKSSDYYKIVLKSCQYSEGKFQITEDSPGLTETALHENTENTNEVTGYKYQLDSSNTDSLKQNTFTLVDVQFKDPLNTEKIAYHLYVPVYTVKQMTYTFKSSALTDTKSVAYPHEADSEYEKAFGEFHVDSLNTWVTQYVRFTYSKQDMDNLLLTGNLDWNHEKYILLNTQAASERLPNGTNMILVDPNGFADKTYYGKINTSGFKSTKYNNLDSWRIDLNKFTKNGKADGEKFKVCNFSEVLSSHITVTQEDGGAYKDVTDEVKNNSSADYSIYDSRNDKYYLYTSDGTGTYTLTADDDINEDYYISIYVPKPETYKDELYFYSITSPDKLEGRRSAEISKSDSKSCNVMIADLFTQKEDYYSVAPPNDTISTDNPTITVKASSTISFSNTTVRSYLSNANLYHAFHLLLNRHEADSSINNEIIGLNEDGITANYSINDTTLSSQCTIDLQSGYLDAKTEDVMGYFSNMSNQINEITVSAEIQMQFYDTEEFPEKISEGDIGVNVAASSNLAYEEERLSYTSMSQAFTPDGKYYHRESATAAHLSYSAVSELDEYDIQGKNSKNFSRLGVNGFSSIGKYGNRTAMEIHSRAVFNAASVEEQYFQQAASIRFSMTLWKKTDTKAEDGTITSAAYEQVDDISKYLLGVEFMNININMSQNNVKSDAKTYVYDLAMEGCNVLGPRIYPVDIVYYAISGVGFTEYANYKVQIQAELLNAEGKTIGNQPKDYIVYTNAKVFPTVIGQDE